NGPHAGAGGEGGPRGLRGLPGDDPAAERPSPAAGRHRPAPAASRRSALTRPMAARAVIFDLDGTLADSLGDIASAMNRTLEAHGFPVHPVSAYRTFVGEGVRKLVERALPPGAEQVREAFITDYQADYAEHLLDATRLFPGIPEVLDGLQRA